MGQPGQGVMGQGQCPGWHWGIWHCHVAQGAARMCLFLSQPLYLLPDTWGPPGHAGSTSIPCQEQEEWRGAVFTEAGSERPRGVTPREPCRGKNMAATSPEHGKGTLRHREAAQRAAPLSTALGAERTPGHPWAGFDRPWLVHKASPSSLPVPPPPHGQPLAALPSPAARVPLGWTCVKIIKGCLAWSRLEDPGRACHGEQRRWACVADAVAAPAAHVPVLALQRPLSTHHHPRSSPDQQHTARGTW